MTDKLIINCITKEKSKQAFTLDELNLFEQQRQQAEEQELLNSLIPSDKEMLMAEVEIQTITILMEVGLI